MDFDSIREKAIRGIVVLTGRTFFLSFLSLGATGLLGYFLGVADFGVFWAVSAVVNFLNYFSDIGLAAALVQKKDKLEQDELDTTFMVQQALVLICVVLLIVLSPFITAKYQLPIAGTYLLYALAISLLMSSLKTIPSILLERKLEFQKLVFPQILETIVYNFVAVFFAWKGFGVYSFIYAVLARGVVGLVVIYWIQPWFPTFKFSRKALSHLLRYGIPYQANTFLASLKDDGMTVILGWILGPTGVGYLGWAQKWAQAPLRFFMDHVIRVTFPTFARLQSEKEKLESALTRSIFFICFLVFPSIAVLLVLAPILVNIIPKYQKWEPALLPLFIISINTVFAAVTTQLTNLLNSIGKIKTTFKLMVMWTILTWLFIPILSIKFGFVGASIGYALVGVSSIVAIYLVRGIVNFKFVDSVGKPFLASLAMGAVILMGRNMLTENFTSFWILVVLSGVTYALFSYIIYGQSIVDDVKRSFQTFFQKG